MYKFINATVNAEGAIQLQGTGALTIQHAQT